MKRSLFLCVLMIMILGAGIFSAYAVPLGQTENTEENAPAAEGESAIELITREESAPDGTASETETPADETASEDAAAENGEAAAEETADAEPEPVIEAPEAPVPEAPKGSVPSKEVGFYWTPSANAEHYELTYGIDRGIEGITLELPADDWTCQAGRCILFEELPSDGNYTWTVSAINEGGSAASEETSFAVLPNISSPDAYLPGAVLGNHK